MEKITKKIKLDLKDVPLDKRVKAKNDIGEYVIDEILRAVSEGKSPVSGEKFKRLNKKYAKEEKNGDRTPNLELEGDLLDSLTFKRTKEGIEVGIFSAKETPKADGHNNFSGKSKLPKRRFIPEKNQNFKNNINKGIKTITKDFESNTRKRQPLDRITTIEQSSETVAITVDDIFASSFLDDFLKDGGFI